MIKYLYVLLAITFTSCYVQHPRFTTIDKVEKLKLGLHIDSVSKLLDVKPYDFISLDSSRQKTVLYKYRVKEIRRIPVLMRKTKGVEVDGKWKDLIVDINSDSEVIAYRTENEQLSSVTDKKKADPNKIIQGILTTITVTLPTVLVYLSSR